MYRRRFLELMGMTVAAGTVAYSFPSIIVPQNLIKVIDSDLIADFYHQQVLLSKDWFMLNRPMGLTYMISNGNRVLRGFDTSTFEPLQ